MTTTITTFEDPVLARDRVSPGPALYFTAAMPREAPKAVLAMVHGYADHGGRYAHVARALAERGIGAVTLDLRGHGRAEGTRGYCSEFREFLDDVREFPRILEKVAPSAPAPFLFGHSFGGLVATLHVTEARENAPVWRGLVLSGPFFGLAFDVPRLKVAAGKIASRVYPKFALPSGLKGKDMTHDVARAAAYDSDSLVFKKTTARWFTEAAAAQTRAFAAAPRLTLPLYTTLGTADTVASTKATKRFFDAAGSSDKTWKPRENLFHEVFNEPSWESQVDDLAAWIFARV